MSRTLRTLSYIAIPTAATTYGIHLGLTHLEEKYPALPISAGSNALSTPKLPNQRCAYTDIYAARIRLDALQSYIPNPSPKEGEEKHLKRSLEEAWARAVLSSKPLSTEASIIGLLTSGSYSPGDTGQDGFGPDSKTGTPRALLHGLFVVEREPSSAQSRSERNGLLVSWKMADNPRLFFEKIARWGYPWRLMSGGRHEMSVSEPFEVLDQGKVVEVRFSAAHDYEVVAGEGDSQKILPEWTNRLHRGYARFVLDAAVKEVVEGGLKRV